MNGDGAPEVPNDGTAGPVDAPSRPRIQGVDMSLDETGFNPYGSGPLPIQPKEPTATPQTSDVSGDECRVHRAGNEAVQEVIWLWLYV